MKQQLRFAFLFGLLVVGILVAPVPSEAASLTISPGIPNGGGISYDGPRTIPLGTVNTGTGCSPVPSGFTSCYLITLGDYTGVCDGACGRSWNIANANTGGPARLLVNDVASGGTNLMILTGVAFKPALASPAQTLKVVYEHLFNAAAPPGNNSGAFITALRSGGYWQGDATVAPISSVNNVATLTGTGNFGTAGFVSVGTLTTPAVNVNHASDNFPLQQGQTGNPLSYPSFYCNTDSVAFPSGPNHCVPTLHQEVVITVASGRDAVQFPNSNDQPGILCDIPIVITDTCNDGCFEPEPGAQITDPTNLATIAANCDFAQKAIKLEFRQAKGADKAAFRAANAHNTCKLGKHLQGEQSRCERDEDVDDD